MERHALIEPPLEIVDFGLTGAAGEVTKQTLYGRYTALVFGYTHCPDFCPTTMSRMAGSEISAQHAHQDNLDMPCEYIFRL